VLNYGTTVSVHNDVVTMDVLVKAEVGKIIDCGLERREHNRGKKQSKEAKKPQLSRRS